MISYALIYKQIRKLIRSNIGTDNKVIIGFTRRDATSEEEMTTYPYLYCKNEMHINPLNVNVQYDDADLRLDITFDENRHIRDEQILTTMLIKHSFESDLEIDNPYFWSILIINNDYCSLFALDLISIELLPNNDGASIICKALAN